MTRVRFELPAGFDPQLCGEVPIKVINSRMELVAQVPASASLGLRPGRYVAQTVLPGGQTATTAFSIPRRSGLAIGLRLASGLLRGAVDYVANNIVSSIVSSLSQDVDVPARDTAPPRARPELSISLRTQPLEPPDVNRTEADSGGTTEAKVRIAELSHNLGPAFSVDAILAGHMPQVIYEPLTLQFAQPRQPVWNIRVPVSEHESARIDYHRHPNGWFPHVRLANPRAELLLQYSSSQQASEFAQIAAEGQALAEEGLDGDGQGPVVATLGAYALLRTGQLDKVAPIVERLLAGWPNLPDAQIIAGEYCARAARHPEAVAHFLSVSGLPFARLGLRFQIDRLAGYARIDKASSGAEEAILTKGAAIRERYAALSDFAARVNFDRPLLTFTDSAEAMADADYRALPWERVELGAREGAQPFPKAL